MISTRGRYALRVMIDLAENWSGRYIPMKDVAKRQNISLKYIERIVPVLTKNQFIEGQHGKGGGYRLLRKPEEYKVGEILRLTEGALSPVSCAECEGGSCERAGDCRTLPMWQHATTLINNYFDGITIADLMAEDTIHEIHI